MSPDVRSWLGLLLAKNRRRSAVLAAAATLAVAAGLGGAALGAEGKSSRGDGKALQMCTGKYALCDAAACTPIPEQHGFPGAPVANPSHALCECQVETGQNLGPGPCSLRIPRGKNGEYILSTYSFALNKPYLTCPAGGNRTVCFGYPCVIDDKDPKRAHCTCPITYQSAEFKTQGGDCDPKRCSSVLWQGGTPHEYDVINAIFAKATKETPPPNCAPTVK